MSALALGIPLTAVTLLGLLLNLYIIVVVILSKQVHSANNLLLLHLGVVDVCVGVVLGVLLVCRGALGGAGLGLGQGLSVARAQPCTPAGFLLSLLHPLALWTLCGLHTDRYFAISTPLHYGAKVSTRKVLWGLAVSWLGSLLLALLALLPGCAPVHEPAGAGAAAAAGTQRPASATTTAASAGLAADAPDAAPAPWSAPWPVPWGPVAHAGIYTAATLLLPATIVLVCNLKVLMIARHHRHRIASAIFEVTLSAQVTITHQRNPFVPLAAGGAPGPRPEQAPPAPGISPGAAAAVAAAAAAKFRSRSALCPVLQLLGSLVLLYFPYYGLLLWDALAASHAVRAPHPHFSTLAMCLITCSPPVNGLLYGVKNKVLRKTIQNYWRKQMSKSEVNQEIQARTPSTCGSRRPSLTPAGASGVAGALSAAGAGLGASPGGGGGTGSSTLQRRLSEIVLEPLRSSISVGSASASPRGSKFQRIASDLAWRPWRPRPGPRHWLLARSLSSIEQHGLRRSRSLKDGWHHSSNTLQIPSVTSNGDLTAGGGAGGGGGSHPWTPLRGSSVASLGGGGGAAGGGAGGGSLFVQRVLGHCHNKASHSSTPRHSPSLLLASVSRRSPRILITRAFSEESESGPAAAPAGAIHHSTSASALVTDGHHANGHSGHTHGRRWRRIRYRDEDDDDDDDAAEALSALSGHLSDESSSPSEQQRALPGAGAPVADGNLSPCSDGEERALLFSPASTSACCSPVSSPEPIEEEQEPEPDREMDTL
ncbi:Dopamine receptor 2 [Frankliniella fusca]|uniref:Dopamine receptor 2 n=1 Tax=Frankliniella fusca TaxID=407009 RepID=A0AAE1I0I2_9NEOP|nr:Dopamine receptor 2 [Frankliniella fusca]